MFPYQDPSAGGTDPSASSGCGSKLVRGTGQGRSAGGYLTSKAFVLKGPGGGVRRVHLPLDSLIVLPPPKVHRLTLIPSLSKLLWSNRKPMVRRQVCCQRPRNGGQGMPDLESHWLAERLSYLGRSLSRDMMRGQKVRDVFLRLESHPETEGRFKPKGAGPFTRECRKSLRKLPWSSDLSRSLKELFR